MPPATFADATPPVALLPPWLHRVMLVGIVGFLLVSVVVSVAQNLDHPWTSARLAPSFALARGYPLYSLPGSPPWVMVGHGPFYPVMYLPCVFARGPVAAVAAAVALTHLFIFVPVGMLCGLFGARRGVERGWALETGALAAWLGFAVLVFVVGSLDYIARRVHVDAPTFGLLLLACFAALRADPPAPGRASVGWTLAAGVLAGLSACCEMNALGSVGALALYVGWSEGWRRTAVFTLAAALTGGIVYGWAAWQSSAAAIAHHFHTLDRFPWYNWTALKFVNLSLTETSRRWPDKLFSAAYLGLQGVQTYAVPFLATALAGYVLSRRLPAMPVPEAAPAIPPLPNAPAHRVIGCLLFVALMGAPAALVSVARYGGAINGWAFVALPLSVAGVLAVTGLLENVGRTGQLLAHVALGSAALAVALAAGAYFCALHPWRGTAMQEAFQTVRTHPGQCYFASDPLAHLLAGERFRPNLDTVYSYAVAGLPVDADAFRAAMPARLEYLALSPKMESWGLDELHRLLPEENMKTDQLSLRFYEVWTKP